MSILSSASTYCSTAKFEGYSMPSTISSFPFVCYESSRGIHRLPWMDNPSFLFFSDGGAGTQCGCPRGRRSSVLVQKGFKYGIFKGEPESAERGYVTCVLTRSKQALAVHYWPGLAIEKRTKTTVQGRGGGVTVGLGWVYVTRNRYSGALSSGAEEIRLTIEIRPSSVPAIALRKKKKIMKNKKRRYEPEGVYARGGVWFPYSSPRP